MALVTITEVNNLFFFVIVVIRFAYVYQSKLNTKEH